MSAGWPTYPRFTLHEKCWNTTNYQKTKNSSCKNEESVIYPAWPHQAHNPLAQGPQQAHQHRKTPAPNRDVFVVAKIYLSLHGPGTRSVSKQLLDRGWLSRSGSWSTSRALKKTAGRASVFSDNCVCGLHARYIYKFSSLCGQVCEMQPFSVSCVAVPHMWVC